MLDRRAHREKLLVERTKKTFVLTQVRKQGELKIEPQTLFWNDIFTISVCHICTRFCKPVNGGAL